MRMGLERVRPVQSQSQPILGPFFNAILDHFGRLRPRVGRFAGGRTPPP